MAVYHCVDCGNWFDDDYHPGEWNAHGSTCPECTAQRDIEIIAKGAVISGYIDDEQGYTNRGEGNV